MTITAYHVCVVRMISLGNEWELVGSDPALDVQQVSIHPRLVLTSSDVDKFIDYKIIQIVYVSF